MRDPSANPISNTLADALRSGEVTRLATPVTTSWSVLGQNWQRHPELWRHLDFGHPRLRLRSRSALLAALIGELAPDDPHLEVPFLTDRDMPWSEDRDMIARLRPPFEAGGTIWLRQPGPGLAPDGAEGDDAGLNCQIGDLGRARSRSRGASDLEADIRCVQISSLSVVAHEPLGLACFSPKGETSMGFVLSPAPMAQRDRLFWPDIDTDRRSNPIVAVIEISDLRVKIKRKSLGEKESQDV